MKAQRIQPGWSYRWERAASAPLSSFNPKHGSAEHVGTLIRVAGVRFTGSPLFYWFLKGPGGWSDL